METTDEKAPTLRGVSHQYAAFLAPVAGVALVVSAPSGAARVAAGIYGLALCAMLAVSALYHRRVWSAVARRRMRRLDHAMIFLFIAASFTPFPMLALDASLGTPLMIIIWSTACAGLLFKVLWLEAPPWLGATLYVVAGCVIVPYTGEMIDGVGVVGTTLLGVGGICYITGAAVYALRWPDPAPASFGYHEVFHVLVLAGVTVHFVAIAEYAVAVG